MFVVVIAVRGVQVAVVQIVDVVAVGDGDVSALGSVFVGVFGVSHALVGVALVPMVVVLVMTMTVVHVVDVVVVGDRDVTAIGSVNVRMAWVHGHSMTSDARSGWAPGRPRVSNEAWRVSTG